MKIFKEKKNIQKREKRLYDNPNDFVMTERDNYVYCPKCNHTVEWWTNDKKVLCQWCGNYVFKTKKDEFNYRMKGLLKK